MFKLKKILPLILLLASTQSEATESKLWSLGLEAKYLNYYDTKLTYLGGSLDREFLNKLHVEVFYFLADKENPFLERSTTIYFRNYGGAGVFYKNNFNDKLYYKAGLFFGSGGGEKTYRGSDTIATGESLFFITEYQATVGIRLQSDLSLEAGLTHLSLADEIDSFGGVKLGVAVAF